MVPDLLGEVEFPQGAAELQAGVEGKLVMG